MAKNKVASKPRKVPSARQMKAFSKGFTPEQWKRCSDEASFRDALLFDIEEARTIAVRLLSSSTKQVMDEQEYVEDDYRDGFI